MGTEKVKNNGYNFFVKYSHQLEDEKKKLLSRIRRLEQENMLLTERFRGSIEQREQIKESADQVMEILGYLNGLIDRFVKPGQRRKFRKQTQSQKALLMDTLCREKKKFDQTFLGIEASEESARDMPSSRFMDSRPRNSKMSDFSKRSRHESVGKRDNSMMDKLSNSQIQSGLNESIESLHRLKREVEQQMGDEEQQPYTIELDKRDLDSLARKKQQIPPPYLSEQGFLPRKSRDSNLVSNVHQTEKLSSLSSQFKSKGRREKVNISISECNRLFHETLPNSKKRYKSKRRRRNRTKTAEPRRRKKKDPSISTDSNAPYEGLYNRHNSIFNRNRFQIESKESEHSNPVEVNVWDRYNMNLPKSTSTKESRSTQGPVKFYENARFIDSLDQRPEPTSKQGSFKNSAGSQQPVVEFNALKEKKLLQVKTDEKEAVHADPDSNTNEKKNYLRPTDSLRHR